MSWCHDSAIRALAPEQYDGERIIALILDSPLVRPDLIDDLRSVATSECRQHRER
jgi:hypothetical protein